MYLYVYPSIHLSIYLSICLCNYLSIYLCLSVYLCICLSARLKTKLFCETSHFSNLTTSKTKQFCDTSFIFQPNNVQNRSSSARLPQCLNLTTSKTKQFCETSFKNGKLSAALGASCQCVLRFFHSTCVKYCACQEKLMPGHTKCCTCHAKSSQQTWRSDTPKWNPSQEMSALTSEHLWWTCLLYCTCHANASLKILFKCPTPAIVSGNATKPSRFAHFWQGAQSFPPATQNDICTSKSGANMLCFVHFHFEMCFAPQQLHFFDISTLKVLRSWCALYVLTSNRASRHNGVHFFDISTSKSGPRLKCFVHFDLEMCFAPQQRALFWHRNFQKWSDAEVLCTFWLRNVLRATTACTFLTSQLPKVVRRWSVLYILTSKCASRHNGVQFVISHLASWLRTRRFSEPTFRPSGATNHWKNTVFRDFPTFSRICIFFLLTLSLLIFSLLIFLFSLPLPCSAFHLSILSEVWLLNFLR